MMMTTIHTQACSLVWS